MNIVSLLKVFLVPVDSEDPLLYLTEVGQVWLEVALPVVSLGLGSVHLVVQQGHTAPSPSLPPAGLHAGPLQEMLAVRGEVLPGHSHVSSPQLYRLVEQLGLGLELVSAVTWPGK